METIINANVKVQTVLISDEKCIFVAHEDGRGYVLTNNPTLFGNRSESLMARYPRVINTHGKTKVLTCDK